MVWPPQGPEREIERRGLAIGSGRATLKALEATLIFSLGVAEPPPFWPRGGSATPKLAVGVAQPPLTIFQIYIFFLNIYIYIYGVMTWR